MRLFRSAALAILSGIVAAQGAERPGAKTPDVPLTARERALQMLDRFTFGPRPGEVDRVLQMGVDRWFAQQLEPASIVDGVLDTRLQDFPTLGMTPAQALAVFPDRGIVTQVADGKMPYPDDPLLKSVYEVQVYRLGLERGLKLHPQPDLTDDEKAMQKEVDHATAARVAGRLLALPKRERMSALNAMPVPDRIAFATSLQGEERNLLTSDFTPREREAILAFQGGVGTQYRIVDELGQARVLRDVLSERQLQQVMTDFWFNHFNVFAPKDSDQWYTTSYERDSIRPHALGKFRDLLIATAESPAMMVYLDNWLSIGPDSRANGVDPRKPNAKSGRKGLNENYGREVMELHTVGVNGGYSQGDVTQLASILTGWGVDKPNQAGSFRFDPGRHEPGTKQWFGYTIDEQGRVLKGAVSSAAAKAIAESSTPDGMKQGIAALTLLAASPKTAHFIASLLAQQFVADDPPSQLVDRLAATYLASDGDITAILRTLAASPEFNSHRYFRNKVKTPEEFVASVFRATATDPQNPGATVSLLTNQLGQPPYKKLEPTGYYVTADHWMNTQSRMARLNFADQLTQNKFANQKFDSARVLAMGLMADRGVAAQIEAARTKGASDVEGSAGMEGSDVVLKVLEETLIDGEVSPRTDTFIHSQLAHQADGGPANNPAVTLNMLTALLIGSPEFQVR